MIKTKNQGKLVRQQVDHKTRINLLIVICCDILHINLILIFLRKIYVKFHTNGAQKIWSKMIQDISQNFVQINFNGSKNN